LTFPDRVPAGAASRAEAPKAAHKKMAEPNTARIPALDLLRFTAAVAVTLYHYVSCYPAPADAAREPLHAISAVTRYGYLGVDLFFMISGFVILWSSWSRSALDFSISRITRLYPSFWASLVFTAACIYFIAGVVPGADVPELNARTLAANATMVPAIFGAPLVEGVYWTLEIEIRFYALIFVLLLFRSIQRVEPLLYAWIALTIASFFLPMPWVAVYFGLIPYGAFFASGCLFFLVMARGWTLPRAIGLATGLATCIVVALEQRGQFLTADLVSAIVVPLLVVGFFGLFVLLLRPGSKAPSRTSYWLGAITYPLYLTHAMMGYLLYGLLRPKIGLAPTLVAITVLAFLVAIALTITVDIPARKPFARLLQRLASAVNLRTGNRETANPSRPQ